MANFTPNTAYPSGFYQVPYGQPPQPNGAYMTPPNQYVQHRPPPFAQQPPQPGMNVHFPNNAAFASNNQFQPSYGLPHNPPPGAPPPGPPSQFHGYPQFPGPMPIPSYGPPSLPGVNGNVHSPAYSPHGPQSNPVHFHATPQHSSPYLGDPQVGSGQPRPFPVANGHTRESLQEGSTFSLAEQHRDYAAPGQLPPPTDFAHLPGLGSGNGSSNVSRNENQSPPKTAIASVLNTLAGKETLPKKPVFNDESQPTRLDNVSSETWKQTTSKSSQPQTKVFLPGLEESGASQSKKPPQEPDKNPAGPVKSTSEIFQRQWAEKRNRAKSALAQLNERNVSVNLMLEEELDGSLLKNLYGELGISTSPAVRPGAQVTPPESQPASPMSITQDSSGPRPLAQSSGPSSQNLPNKPRTLEVPTIFNNTKPNYESSHRSETSLEPGEVAESQSVSKQDTLQETRTEEETRRREETLKRVEFLKQEAIRKEAEAILKEAEEVRNGEEVRKEEAARKEEELRKNEAARPEDAQKRPPHNPLPKKPLAPAKPMERKDYIARLLAAKEAVMKDTGKATSPANTSAAAVPQATQAPASTQESTKEHISMRPATSQEKEALASGTETKRRPYPDPIQTELIRKKLEALKNNPAYRQSTDSKPDGANVPWKAPGPSSPSISTVNHSTVSSDKQSTIQLPQETTPMRLMTTTANGATEYRPEKSFFAFGNRGLFGGLPGLSPVTGSHASPPTHASKAAINSEETQSESLGPMESQFLKENTNVLGMATPEQRASSGAGLPTKPAMPNLATSNLEGPGTPSKPVTPPKPATQARKRATASDFIDSPPHPKRRVSSNGPIQLVIDVSEDDEEAGGHSEMDMDYPFPMNGGYSQSHTPANGQAKSLRHLPPLTNWPSKPLANSAVSTPPTVDTPQELAKNEEQIRALKQRIAEMEQRKKAKKSGLDTQTPKLVPSSSDIENVSTASKVLEVKKQQFDMVNKKLVEQQTTLAATRSLLQEKLEAEKRTQARIVARAENERKGAAQASGKEERQQRLERKAALEAALPALDSQIAAAQSRMDAIKKQQDEVLAEIERGVSGRKALMEELESLLSLEVELEANSNTAAEASEQQSDLKVTTDTVSSNREASPQVVEDKQHQETLAKMSDSPSDQLQQDQGQEQKDSSFENEQEQEQRNSPGKNEREQEQRNPSVENEQEQKQSNPTVENAQEHQESRSSVENNDAMLEQKMDISDSSSEEGQVSSSGDRPGSQPASIGSDSAGYYEPDAVRDDHSRDASEELSTPDDSDMRERQVVGQSASPGRDYQTQLQEDYERQLEEDYENQLDEQDASRNSPGLPISISSSDPNGDINSEHSSMSYGEGYKQGNVSHDTSVPMHQESLPPSSKNQSEMAGDEHGESDDYEPPEPPLPVDNQASRESSNDLYMYESSDAPRNGTDAMVLDAEDPLMADTRAPGSQTADPGQEKEEAGDELAASVRAHYTPYDSPLKQFTSYRFHPHWELSGGSCNDSTCDYQHFRDFPLSDNTLLVQLGSVHEGKTVEEKQKYVDGLKDVIESMRDRNLHDTEAVASQIVDYRRKFLNDSSRVLTNIDYDVDGAS